MNLSKEEVALGYLPTPSAAILDYYLGRLRGARLESYQRQEHRLREVGAMQMAEVELRGRIDRMPAGLRVPADDVAVIPDLHLELDHLKARHNQRLERLLAEEGRANAETERYRFVDQALDWVTLAHGRRVKLRHRPFEKIKASPSNLAALAAELDAEIERLNVEIAAVAEAPAPAEDVKTRISRAVSEIVAKGAIDIDPRIRRKSPVDLDRVFNVGLGASTLVWLFHVEIEARLLTMAERLNFTGALTDAERDRRVSSLSAERLATERRLAAVLQHAIGVEQLIPRVRPDLDARALLAVEEVE